MMKYLWIVILVIGILLGLIAIFFINRRLKDETQTVPIVPTSLWFLLFLSVLTILISFAVYLYYSESPIISTTTITYPQNLLTPHVHEHSYEHNHQPENIINVFNHPKPNIPNNIVSIHGNFD